MISLYNMHLCEVEGSQQPSGESLHESIQESRTRTTKETRAVQGWELARSTKLCHGCYGNICPCLSMPEKNLKGCCDLLGRPGEWLSDTVLEHYWLVLVRHTLMHHWAVSIALNMGFESLMGPLQLTSQTLAVGNAQSEKPWKIFHNSSTALPSTRFTKA